MDARAKATATRGARAPRQPRRPTRPASGNRPRAAEFFAGIGLMRMGLEEAGYHVVWANDIDRWKRMMYEGHFGKDDFLDPRDIRVIHGSDLPRDLDLATASFPCTDLSIAGKRAGLAGEHSGLFWQFTRILGEIPLAHRPRRVLLENVLGLLRLRDGLNLKECLLELSELNRLGYQVDVLTLDARHFVPQSRPRLFIVGELDADTSDCLKPWDIARASADELRPARLRDFIGRLPDLRWALRDLPKPTCENRPTLPEVLEKLPDDHPVWWNKARESYLYKQMSPRSRHWVDSHRRNDDRHYGTAFRRMRDGRSTAELRHDGLAGCLRTPKGGSARQILVLAGEDRYRVRLLTPRDCANLMGATGVTIADGISANRALFGFGDAVCVPAIRWLVHSHRSLHTA